MSCCVGISWDMGVMPCWMRVPWDMGVMPCWMRISWDMGVMPCWVRVPCNVRIMARRVVVAAVPTIVIARIMDRRRVTTARVVISAFVYCPIVIRKSASASISVCKVQRGDMVTVVCCVVV